MAAEVPDIQSRRDLFDYLEEQMNATYRQVLESQRLEYESTFLKSYLVEVNWNPFDAEGDNRDFLDECLTVPPTRYMDAPLCPDISETEEDGFYVVEWARKSTTIRAYLDTVSDERRRFWLVYSLSDAAELDRVMDRLSSTQPAFDRAWLWPDFLSEAQSRGEFRGVGMDYDYRRFESRKGKADSTNYLKVQLWGGPETKQILDFITQENSFKAKTVLAKVRMKYWDDPEDSERFALEDIKYNGKFTAWGSSFGTHQKLLTDLRYTYSSLIHHIENKYTIKTEAQDMLHAPQGEPIFFNLEDQPIQDLGAFCDVVFSGNLPFRLWGIPEPAPGSGPGVIVSAVDIHTGSKLFFELYPDLICMYLYAGACGNTVARFFTNLQHTFSRLVKSENNEGIPIFQRIAD